MARVDDMVAAVVASGGDTDATEALRRLNQAHEKMVGGSGWLRATLVMGPTVAGTAFYALPVRVVEALFFSVGGVPCGKARHPDVYGYSRDTLLWVGPNTLLVADGDANGVAGVTMIPTPTSALAVSVYGKVLPAAALALGAAPVTPTDMDEALENYAIALCRERDDARMDAGSAGRGLFDVEVERLRRRAAKRFRGNGPSQIRVVGLNA